MQLIRPTSEFEVGHLPFQGKVKTAIKLFSFHHLANSFPASSCCFFIDDDMMSCRCHDFHRLFGNGFPAISAVIEIAAKCAACAVSASCTAPHAVQAVSEPACNDSDDESYKYIVHRCLPWYLLERKLRTNRVKTFLNMIIARKATWSNAKRLQFPQNFMRALLRNSSISKWANSRLCLISTPF